MRKLTLTAILALLVLASTALDPSSAKAEKNQWVAGGLNFFVPGAGYAYNGEKPLYVTVPLILGTAGLVYVEQIHEFDDGKRLQDHDSTAFGVLFGAIFIANTAFAIDAYQEAGRINRREASGLASMRIDLKPIAAGDGSKKMGLSLSGAF